ncbi:MAG: 2-oxoacid:ferredoxin oxidoreductase subunit beta, partial [Rhodoferax sp.]
ALNRMDFIPACAEITTDYAPGELVEVPQHDGTLLRLRKLHEGYDPTDRLSAMNHVQTHQARGEVVTGLLYVDPECSDLHQALNTSATPLNALGREELCPGAQALVALNAALR